MRTFFSHLLLPKLPAVFKVIILMQIYFFERGAMRQWSKLALARQPERSAGRGIKSGQKT
jgi:hypothetical protein